MNSNDHLTEMDVYPENRYAITLSNKETSLNGKGKVLVPGSIIKIKTLDKYGHITFSVLMINDQIVPSPRVYNSPDITNIELFSEDIFKFIVAIKSAADRVNFIKSFDKRALVMKLVPGEPILVPETAFNRFQRNFRRGLVKYVGCVDEMGPGYHFIVSILDSNIKDRRDWCQIPSHLNGIIEKYIGKTDFLSVILSAEHIYHYRTEQFPFDATLFHAYDTSNMSNMRNIEHSERLNKEQSHAKRNSSSISFGNQDTPNNKTSSKTSTEKPFCIDGKDVYVIDATTDADNADVQIIQKTEYFDQLDLLKSQTWPSSAGPQSEMLNSKYDESPSTASGYAKPARNPRVKTPNLLDHINQDNKNTTPATNTTSKHSTLRKQRDSYHNYDNDVNHSNEVDDRVEQFTKIPGSTLGIDAMVTVETGCCEPLNGVIRAIFKTELTGSTVMVGVELEDQLSNLPLNLTDGLFSNHRFFHCQSGKALFIEAECCHKDNRFSDDFVVETKVFGHTESPVITDTIPPISLKNLAELEQIIGESKGIQGHNNSCYLDATLFSMFTFAQCFDSLLYRPADKKDIKSYDQVRAILRDEIVHPLRKHHFVRADRVLKLRELLEQISSMTGLTNEEKDPEEFMNILMAQTLRAEPYLKFNSGQDAFYYQLFVEKNDELTLPNVQQLFEQSFKTSNIKLREVPPCLIIQMPRFGKSYKMYQRIVPSQVLDITDVVEGQPPACMICGNLATTQCLDCPKDYCNGCYRQTHMHQNQNHQNIDIRPDFPLLLNQTVPRIHMDLFAVVCIETSHYVSFVKAGELPDAPWLFFDSMSDRRGGQNGYNIPCMVSVPDMPEWLSEEGARRLHETTPKDKLLPPFAKRLLCDAYMCMYVSRDVSMYK